MMEEWKIRQELYHRINPVHEDSLDDKDIVITEDVVKHGIRYFFEHDIGWIYPSKSFMVGICYSKWLSEEFGGRPLEYLDRQDLLFDNDPYFVRYSVDPRTYLGILDKIGGWDFDQSLGMVPDVRNWFEREIINIGVE